MLISLNYKKIKFNYSLLKIKNLFLNNNFIVFLNIINISYRKLYEIKNELLLLNITSLILNKKYVKLLFNYPDFKFINSFIFCIFNNSVSNIFSILNILNNIEFFFLFENSFSNMTSSYSLLDNLNNIFMYSINIQYLIKKIIFKIIFLLLFFVLALIKYIK